MLIEMRITNFRSIRETQVFSMVAGRFAEHLENNTFDSGLKGFDRLLRTSVIYGPNAAGKTNVIRAIQLLQSLVQQSASMPASGTLPHMPFKLTKRFRNSPTEFVITFAQEGTRYEYGLSYDSEQVQREWLTQYVNPRGRAIFDRIFVASKKKHQFKLSPYFKERARSAWIDSTRPNALFLSTAAQFNSEQLLPVVEWFSKKLVVIAGPSTFNAGLTFGLLDDPNGKEYLLPFLRVADSGIADVTMKRQPLPSAPQAVAFVGSGFIEERPDKGRNLVQVTFSHIDDKAKRIDLDVGDESQGTQILFRTAGAWFNVIKNGEVILVDELEQSLHPLLIRSLIQMFQSNKGNPKNAQLIFTAHNTALLSQDLFRRDQIWFVEKDRTRATRLYSLTEFNPRIGEAIERSYFRGQYGALPITEGLQP